MGNILIVGIIVLWLLAAVFHMHKGRKNGRCPGCSGCSGNCRKCSGITSR